MCVVAEKWDWDLLAQKTCCSAMVFMARCSGAATAAATTLLPVKGNVAASALGTSPAGK